MIKFLFLLIIIIIIETGDCLLHRNYSGIFILEEKGNEIEVKSILSQSMTSTITEMCSHTSSVSPHLFNNCVQCVSAIRLSSLLNKTQTIDNINDNNNNMRLFDVFHFQTSLEYFRKLNNNNHYHDNNTMKLLLVGNLSFTSIQTTFLLIPKRSIVHWMITIITMKHNSIKTEQQHNFNNLHRIANELTIVFKIVEFGSIVQHITDNLVDDDSSTAIVVKVVDEIPFHYVSQLFSELEFYKNNSLKGIRFSLKLNIIISFREYPSKEDEKHNWINEVVTTRSVINWEAIGIDSFGEIRLDRQSIESMMMKSPIDGQNVFLNCPQLKDFLLNKTDSQSSYRSLMGSYTFHHQSWSDNYFIKHYSDHRIKVVDDIVRKMQSSNEFNVKPYKQIELEVVDQNNQDPLLIVTFPYNGEPVAIVQLEYLYDFVDIFIIVEAKCSFTGVVKKELYINKNIKDFENYIDKIRFIVIDSFPIVDIDFPYRLYRRYHNDNASFEHSEKVNAIFKEEYQRDVVIEYLLEYYEHLKYLLVVVDADEIVNTNSINRLKSLYYQINPAIYFNMEMFYYNFQWKKHSTWFHPFVTTNQWVNTYTLSVMRTYNYERTCLPDAGWHCSYCLSLQEIIRKIESFSHTELNKIEFKNVTFMNGKDLFSREQSSGNEQLVLNDVSLLPKILQKFHYDISHFQQFQTEIYQNLNNNNNNNNSNNNVFIMTYSTNHSFQIADLIKHRLSSDYNCVVYIFNMHSNNFNMETLGYLKKKHHNHNIFQIIFDFHEYYSLFLFDFIIIDTREILDSLASETIQINKNRYNKKIYITSLKLYLQLKLSSKVCLDLLFLKDLFNNKSTDDLTCIECYSISMNEFYSNLVSNNHNSYKNCSCFFDIKAQISDELFSFQNLSKQIFLSKNNSVLNFNVKINLSLLREKNSKNEDVLLLLKFSLKQYNLKEASSLFIDFNGLILNKQISLDPMNSIFEYSSVFSTNSIDQDNIILTIRHNLNFNNYKDICVSNCSNSFLQTNETVIELYNMSISYVPPVEKIDMLVVSSPFPSNSESFSNNHCNLLGMDDAVLLNQIEIANISIGLYPRVFCGVYTIQTNHHNKVKAQLNTWLQKCTSFLIFSNQTDTGIRSVSVPHLGDESYWNMWQKVRSIWKFVYNNYLDDFDFFLLGGDDMYYIMENLYEYLNTNEIKKLVDDSSGVYFGRQLFHPEIKISFNSGGSGYIIDKVALEILFNNLNKPHCYPNYYDSREDVLISHCLFHSSINKEIVPINTSYKFHTATPGFEFRCPINSKLYEYDNDHKKGFDCCSKKSISFHLSVNKEFFPNYVYDIDNFLYKCDRRIKEEYYKLNGISYYDRYIKYSSEP